MSDKEGSSEAADRAQATLEEFFIACQKSLARSSRNAIETGKADSEFAQGERPVYMIGGLDIELNAGVSLIRGADRASADRVGLDFDAPAEERSAIRFRVESKPVELLDGAKLELANLDPLGEELPDFRFRVWLVDDHGSPVPHYPVVLHFARAGDSHRRKTEDIQVNTDVVGRVDFFLRNRGKPDKNLKVVGVRNRFTVYVKNGAHRYGGPDEFYLWATCKRKDSWAQVVTPAAPRPPGVPAPESPEPDELYTELLRLRFWRED